MPRLKTFFDDVQDHIEQQILFAVDMMVKAAWEYSDTLRQLSHGHGGIAYFNNQL